MLVLAGDHCGPEVVAEALKVLSVIELHTDATFNLTHELVGGCSIEKHGVPITGAVLKKAQQSGAVFFGSVGGPEW
jgi:3-isopropylmalate dehydrogenase